MSASGSYSDASRSPLKSLHDDIDNDISRNPISVAEVSIGLQFLEGVL